MKNNLPALLGFLLLSTPLAATAQFIYTTNNGTITITGYTGPGGAVTIPDTINGLPVTAIGNVIDLSAGGAFQDKSGLTSVTIPDTVTNIGNWAFFSCTSLTNVTIPNAVNSIGYQAFSSCSGLTTVTLPDSVTSLGNYAFNNCYSLASVPALGSITSIGEQAFFNCTNLTRVTLPGSVASIGNFAFWSCSSLTNVTIPRSVTSIGNYAFEECSSLTGVFFNGNTPSTVGLGAFDYISPSVYYYYLPGTIGWGATFAGRPTRLWNPLMQSSGIGPAGFGFNITGTSDIPIVIDAAASLANPSWVPLQRLNLTNGAFYFTDPNWTNYPARFYRIRSP